MGFKNGAGTSQNIAVIVPLPGRDSPLPGRGEFADSSFQGSCTERGQTREKVYLTHYLNMNLFIFMQEIA